MKQKATGFNPVKMDKDGVQAKRVVWSTEALNLALKGLEDGRKLVANPFYENQTKLLKGDLVFRRTEEEIDEWKRCATDIIYFANKYCKLMTPEGIKNIKLRDYQVNYLNHLVKNRLSIYLACRQCAKCNSFITNVLCKFNDDFWKKFGYKLKNKWDKIYYIKEQDCYMIPMFEIYNLYDNRILWKIRYQLYKKLYKLIHLKVKLKKKIYCLLDKLIMYLIDFLDSFEKNNTKLIHTFDLDGIFVNTDTGFKSVSHIHMTKKFVLYKVLLENGFSLECADNHIVFDKHMNEVFVKDLSVGDFIQTKDGIKKIIKKEITNTKICMCDITVDDENHRYYTNGILSHNTTTSALFMLHYILFNVDKNALVLGNKRKTAVEILDKAKKIFIELPYFLRPGIYKWNEGEIVLDNGCRLMAEATTINSGISFTFHCVLADEFAHVQPNIIDKFYNNLFPTITAGKARFMITSTQNGYNLFYRLCKAAEARENEYGFFKTDWDEVPEWNPDQRIWEKRDEAWHRLQVANYGSEEAFNKQFGTNFDVNSNTLISTKIIRKYEKIGVEFIRKEMPGVMGSEYFFWDPNYDLENLKKDFFVITIDIAEGVSGDDTIFLLNRLYYDVDKKDIFTEAVGYFKSNIVGSKKATTILKDFCQNYLNINNYLISLEYNLYGELFAKYIIENIEKDPMNAYRFNEDIIMKYWNEEMTKYTLGKKITSKSKQMGVSLFKQQFEKGEITNISLQFLSQLSNFSDSKGNGTYAACFGHDDLVMAQLQMVFVRENPQYKSLCEMYLATLNGVELEETSYNPYEQTYGQEYGYCNIYG